MRKVWFSLFFLYRHTRWTNLIYPSEVLSSAAKRKLSSCQYSWENVFTIIRLLSPTLRGNQRDDRQSQNASRNCFGRKCKGKHQRNDMYRDTVFSSQISRALRMPTLFEKLYVITWAVGLYELANCTISRKFIQSSKWFLKQDHDDFILRKYELTKRFLPLMVIC